MSRRRPAPRGRAQTPGGASGCPLPPGEGGGERSEPPGEGASFERDPVARAPGKLVLAGEYAVLEPGAPALVMAVDRYVRAAARRLADPIIRLDAPGAGLAGVVLGAEGGRLIFPPDLPSETAGRAAFAAHAAARALARTGGGVALLIDSAEFATGGRKLGLGSSAAVAAAVVRATFAAHGHPIDACEVFRLAYEAHLAAQGGKGSGVDVAASAFGGVRVYVRPEAAAEATARPVSVHADLRFIAAWTGVSSDTRTLVQRTRDVLADPAFREPFLASSREAVHRLAEGLGRGDATAIRTATDRAGDLIRDLGRRAGVDLETAAIARLREALRPLGVAAKVSGAGGGDLAVAIVPPGVPSDAVTSRVEACGLGALDVKVAPAGADVERGG